MKRRGTTVFIACLIVSALFAAGGIAYNIIQRSTSKAAPATQRRAVLPELVPAPMTVTLTSFDVHGLAAVAARTPVTVGALGASITEVQLYDSDVMVARQHFADGTAVSTASDFEFAALQEGPHVLYARAIGKTPSEVAFSAPLRIEAVAPIVMPDSVQLNPNGLSLNEIAASTGVAVQDLQVIPGLAGPQSPPASDAPLIIEDPAIPLPIDVQVLVPSASIPEQAPRSLAAESVPGTSSISVAIDGCSARVATTGSDELTVYDTGGGGPGFTALAKISADAAYTTAELAPGPHIFVAGVVGRPADAAPVSVVAGDDCREDVWTGDASLLDGELRILKPASNGVWLYLGVDDGPFVRIPAVGTMNAPSGRIDLSHSLPRLSGERLRMEVWHGGPTAESPALLLARSQADLDDAALLPLIVGETVSVTLTGPSDSVLKPDTPSLTFYWGSDSPRIDSVQWQVITQPLFSKDRSTTPAVMIATGISAVDTGGIKINDSTHGEFTIPANLLVAGRSPDQPAGPVAGPSLTFGDIKDTSIAIGTTPLASLDTGRIFDDDLKLVIPPDGDVYVRVLPLEGGAVIGDASNLAGVTLYPPQPRGDGFRFDSLTFDPGRAANQELENCVRATVNSVPPAIILAAVTKTYTASRTWCASDFATKGNSCGVWCGILNDVGSAFSFLAKVWDVIAAAYNGIIKYAVLIIAKFNPYCLTARIATSVAKSTIGGDVAAAGGAVTGVCEKIGKVVAKAVISAALSVVGLPAQLPTSTDLKALLAGNLKGLASAYLESLGVPCGEMKLSADEVSVIDATGAETPGKDSSGGVDVCGSMLDATIGALTQQIAQIQTDQVVNSTGLPAPLPGTTIAIEPRGLYHGATVTVGMSPINPAESSSATCTVRAVGTVPSQNTDHGPYNPVDVVVRRINNGVGKATYNGTSWSAVATMAPINQLYDYETIAVRVTSSDCFPGESFTRLIPPTHPLPPLGKWSPGQAD